MADPTDPLIPPDDAIKSAITIALFSPCMKSRRGCVIFNRVTGEQASLGRNTPPPGVACDGSLKCQRDCAKRCRHAEAEAIASALMVLTSAHNRDDFDLLHVRLDEQGQLASDVAPSPSCWQCSRDVMALGFGGIWLFEHHLGNVPGPKPFWRYWPAREFHQQTMKRCDVHHVEVAHVD